MSTSMTGLFLGAGASYEVGMPIVWELTTELKDWLTPDKLYSLNAVWRAQGGGHSDEVIDDMARVLAMPDLHYESILGYLETQFQRTSRFQQEYHALYSWLVQIVYYILYLRHTQNVQYIERYLRYYEGIAQLAQQNLPLWIFSLNHDVIVEALATHCNIPLNCGFTNEIVSLPLRDKHGTKTGELQAETLTCEQLERGAMSFFPDGTPGINLLKIHGALDVFTFRDGKDLLKLLPVERSVLGVIDALRAANEELIYIHPAVADHPVKVMNEIAYADDQGEMQFLRRSLLAGVFKYGSRTSQVIPLRLLDHFRANLNYITTLICIGYGFGDLHINQVIQRWLEFTAGRKLEIVRPGILHIPSFLLHLVPQVVLRDAIVTEYLDLVGVIDRCRREGLEKRLSVYVRKNGIRAQAEMQAFLNQHTERLIDALAGKIVSLPIRDGNIDLHALGMSPEEFAHWCIIESGGAVEDIIEAFLNSMGA